MDYIVPENKSRERSLGPSRAHRLVISLPAAAFALAVGGQMRGGAHVDGTRARQKLQGEGRRVDQHEIRSWQCSGEEGTRRLMQLIRTWNNLKIWHVQFNILNRETLLAAQKEPDKYRDLVVRIAGYSAYFVDLSPDQQAEIIARTEEAA
jgi:hypothetical protein